MFESLQDGLQSAFKQLRGQGKLTESNMREGLKTVETAMLDADVAVSVVDQFMTQVTQAAVGSKVLLALRPHEELVRVVYDELVKILGPVDSSLGLARGRLKVLMLCGLQGAGKTTTCGKLCTMIKEQKLKPFMVAADLQRPAAIEQLHVIGDQVGVQVYSQTGAADPVAVCRDGIAQAKAAGADVVILDTAGRLAIDQELMRQLQNIDKQVGPDQILLVVDGMTGQDAVNSAAAFHKALELDGVIMTKLDGDARGGALLSVKSVTGVPIKFIGTGEHLDALEPFRPEGMASRILQMGDILEVAREAHRLVDEDERLEMEERMRKGQFSLVDFRNLMDKLRKPGLMTKMMGLMPGMGEMSKMLSGGQGEKQFKSLVGMIDSMTVKERNDPKAIDTQRRMRIAKGSGVMPQQVNDLVKMFDQMKPLMTMASGGSMKDKMGMLKNMQGMMSNPFGGMGGPGGGKLKQSTGKRLTPKEREKMQRDKDKMLKKLRKKQ